jgi:endonuclease/exonuclease/phosphatase family metal-dependent hydrolase
VVFPLIIFNFLFVIYWLFKLKFNVFVSVIVLVIAHFHFGSFFQYSTESDISKKENSLAILSYNVHMFNGYEENPQPKAVSKTFAKIVEEQQPDVICIQEYYTENKVDFSAYPYQFIYFKEKNKLGHAIFSKYPIINKHSFDFSQTYNNSIYADIVKGKDTIRIYNLHLQSLGIKPEVSYLQEIDKDKFIKRITRDFVKQQTQAELILAHKQSSKYPVLIVGDFNNTPFSYVYHKLSENLNDAFIKKGNGIGTTYLFDLFPTRIDYILASDAFEIESFENIKTTFSDHYPVSATVTW